MTSNVAGVDPDDPMATPRTDALFGGDAGYDWTDVRELCMTLEREFRAAHRYGDELRLRLSEAQEKVLGQAHIEAQRDEFAQYAVELRSLLEDVWTWREGEWQDDFIARIEAALAKNPTGRQESRSGTDTLGPQKPYPAGSEATPSVTSGAPASPPLNDALMVPRQIPADAKIDSDNITDKDCADLAACLEREHVKRVIADAYKMIADSGFAQPYKDAFEGGIEEVEYRLLESWGENPSRSGLKDAQLTVGPVPRSIWINEWPDGRLSDTPHLTRESAVDGALYTGKRPVEFKEVLSSYNDQEKP